MKQLIIDKGNTNTKIAIFEGEDLVVTYKYHNNDLGTFLYDIVNEHTPQQSIMSSTSNMPTSLLQFLQKIDCFMYLDHNTKLPIEIKYETPQTIGKDRIAGAIGAHRISNGVGCSVIDFGTCITTNVINAYSEYLGGNISPGIYMRIKAMHTFTAHLPIVEVNINDDFIGTSTIKALQNGAVLGTFREVDSFIDDVEQKLNIYKHIATGGDAHLFANWTKKDIFVDPNLVLLGLKIILDYNVN